MPRYYFHLIDDFDAPDEEGRDLPDLTAARKHAALIARFTMAETLKEEGKLVRSHRIQIEDECGATLGEVYFGDVVVIED